MRPQGDALMFRYMAAVPLLLAAMSAQNAPPTNKGRHLDIPAISRKANGSIVSIVMSDKDGHPLAQGSGFLVSRDGHVVTNYHVIKTGSSAIVRLPDGAFFVVDGVLASDKHRDVAIIKAHGNNFRPLTLGDSTRLQVGEEVVAIGNPLSLESTVSNGIVSAIQTVEEEGGKFLQVTAPISPGSSGGPLFNMAGEVVGITTSHIKGGENLNFAIPINDAKSVLAWVTEAVSALPNEVDETAENHDSPSPPPSTSPNSPPPSTSPGPPPSPDGQITFFVEFAHRFTTNNLPMFMYKINVIGRKEDGNEFYVFCWEKRNDCRPLQLGHTYTMELDDNSMNEYSNAADKMMSVRILGALYGFCMRPPDR